MFNIEVEQEFFNRVKEQFISLDTNIVDPEIKEVLDLFKTSDLLDVIVPRWSCQGHDEISGSAEYNIIFCTVKDGFKTLYNLFNEIYEEYISNGIGYDDTANPHMQFVRLLLDDFDPQEHVVIAITTYGRYENVLHCKNTFMNVLNKHQRKV